MDLSLAEANSIIEHTLAAQAKNKLKPMAVVVLSSAGTIRASASQDGTSLMRPKVAHGKAFGAISLGMGSRALFERAKQEPFFIQSANALADGALVPVAGGVLVKNKDGELLGAVGVTGDTSDNDELVAVAGIEAAGFVAQIGA